MFLSIAGWPHRPATAPHTHHILNGWICFSYIT
uniref:Uncharacterized protein n=1 Tax=Arundo donax TaxID=35708 RepID=A0A0A9G3D7_ARUDO